MASYSNGFYRSSYSWTEPADRYSAWQRVEIKLSVKIEDFVWMTGAPERFGDSIMAGIFGEKAFRDERNVAEARIATFFGDILNRSDSRTVRGIVPEGKPGQKIRIFIGTNFAGAVYYVYEWVEPAVMEGSFWELASVEILKNADTPNSRYVLSRGWGDYQTFDPDERFEVTYLFTEPGERIYAGQKVELTLTAEIKEYIWKGQFNFVGGRISAGFLPGLPFKNPQGEWSAGVSGKRGKSSRGARP
ncbi:MAG: hypothetical protein MZV70_69070 [Desulfobacterales bacterium]|nr:hypothetical protein [Desulfobacterales bacterium]